MKKYIMCLCLLLFVFSKEALSSENRDSCKTDYITMGMIYKAEKICNFKFLDEEPNRLCMLCAKAYGIGKKQIYYLLLAGEADFEEFIDRAGKSKACRDIYKIGHEIGWLKSN